MTDVLVIADRIQDDVTEITAEMVTVAAELANGTDGAVHVGVVGTDDRAREAVSLDGVDRIHALEYDGPFNPEVYTRFVVDLVEAVEPGPVLCPHTANGLDFAPAVAERLDRPITTDVFDLALDGSISASRKVFESKVNSTVTVDGDAAVVTVGEHEWAPTERSADPEYGMVRPDWVSDPGGPSTLEFRESEDSDIDITDAEFIIGVGRGIQDKDNLGLVEALCEATGATLACSRPLVEHGWLPWSRQVGKSGHTVSPQVYVAIGISGAIEHLVGMKGSQLIVAINDDPNAPIFEIADYGIVGDLFEIVPAITDHVS